MTILKNKACRWTLLAASTSLLPALHASAVQAQVPHPESSLAIGAAGLGASLSLVSSDIPGEPAMTEGQELYLEVTLNQAASRQLARFILQGERFYASAATLRELGLKWPGSPDASGLVALDDLPGLQVKYDVGQQRISLLAPLELLDRAPVRMGFEQPARPQIDPASRTPGLILNYDLFGQHNRDFQTLSGWSEWRLFGLGAGVWSNTMSSRLARGDELPSTHENIRLDTSWALDFPDRMLTLTVGDTVTGGVAWSRATRIGGVRLSRNFSLQPYRITGPLASFAGEAVLPSTVDLFINGLRQSSQQVQPGQFQIDSMPSLNGMGQAQMVITDLNGQSRVVNFSLYGSPQLLQDGLSDWSLETGMVRRQYGLRSFSYGNDPMLSASGRYGLSDRTTLEAHAETTDGLQLVGMGGLWLLGEGGGVLSAALAGSRHQGLGGMLSSLGYQWNSQRFNLNLDSTRRDADFRDVASLENAPLPRKTDQAYLGMNSRWGQLGASYIRQQYPDQEPARFASLNWSRQLPHNATINLSLNRDLDNDRGNSAFLFWSMPLDRATSVAASARHDRNAQSISLDANHSVPSDLGGWGWRAQTTLGDNAGGQAQLSQLGRYGQWTAGFNHWRGDSGMASSTTAYASANGGLVLMAGHAYAMRRVEDAFALVSTSGVANVPVMLENRLVGHTDANGLLLINRLNAWQRNQLAIDPMQLPADMSISRTTLDAVPESRSGMLADFAMHRALSVQLSLHDTQGRQLPAGSAVWFNETDARADNPVDTVVGQDGLVYLQDPAAGTRLHVRAAGHLCVVDLPALQKTLGLADLGVLICQ